MVAVECKRPQSQRSLERNVDDARRQLRGCYESATCPGCVDVIAIDPTKILNSTLDLLRPSSGANIGDILYDVLAACSREYERVWQKHRDQRTVAVLLHFNVLAHMTQDSHPASKGSRPFYLT